MWDRGNMEFLWLKYCYFARCSLLYFYYWYGYLIIEQFSSFRHIFFQVIENSLVQNQNIISMPNTILPLLFPITSQFPRTQTASVGSSFENLTCYLSSLFTSVQATAGLLTEDYRLWKVSFLLCLGHFRIKVNCFELRVSLVYLTDKR